jgi:hypothetical protein
MLRCATLVLALSTAALCAAAPALGYTWPVKPFKKMHALRGGFDDPRYHVGAEGALSAFHFGVDIAVRDGTPVYSVSSGWALRHNADVTVHRGPTDRAFGYWHIRPVVRNGQRVRVHQLLGYVRKGWGHVHFSESVGGIYVNPLRKSALTPYRDKTIPVVSAIRFVTPDGAPLTDRIRGTVDLEAEAYDLPPRAPAGPWQVARLTPAYLWWKLWRDDAPVGDWNLEADFGYALMPGTVYWSVYAPGTYQNKAHRPGRYIFWLTRGLDTTTLPDGRYRLDVKAEDTRWNSSTASLDFTIANGLLSYSH